MGNQSSAASPVTPRPLYTVRSEPWPDESKPAANATTSTEPADSDECHACAARQDSPAVALAATATVQPRAGTVFASTLRAASTTRATTPNAATTTPATRPCYAYSHSACPLNRAELGRAAWAHLHTTAAYYPLQPSDSQQRDMREFMLLYVRQYPCLYCRDRTMEEVDRNPPRVVDRSQLAEWLCEVHNEVNERLGKAAFDCRRVDERWRTGPSDGSCGSAS